MSTFKLRMKSRSERAFLYFSFNEINLMQILSFTVYIRKIKHKLFIFYHKKYTKTETTEMTFAFVKDNKQTEI